MKWTNVETEPAIFSAASAHSESGLNQRFALINLDTASNRSADFPVEVRRGLSQSPKSLPPRFFYDAAGSRLFEAISELPEYYLTRAEREILEKHAEELAAAFPDGVALIEFGSGSAAKTRILLEAFLIGRPALRYLPIDISKTILEESSRRLLADHPGLEIIAIAGEYREALAHLPEDSDGPKLFLWLGSNISNLDRHAAIAFLDSIRESMNHADRILVGFDLRKDRKTLEAAYNDPGGVTARFNLNVLARVNRELAGHFDLGNFQHQAVYNENAGRIEIYIVSRIDQEIRVDALDMSFRFAEGERIHTENSYKYSQEGIEDLAEATGLKLEQQWFDAKRRFSEVLFAAK